MNLDPDHTGEIIDGRYRVGERLGQGGMGSIYRAEHLGLAQQRAIKFLRADLAKRPSERRRFLQEAKIVSRLHHPHIVEVFDVGDSGDTAYYVMELLFGEDLRARLRREGALPWDQARTIARQICDALDAAHRGGVVHRDLKPENCFLVRRSDNSVLLKLLDFGVAKVTVETDGDRLTGTGETLGTVGYMAPEQLEGAAHPCVDVYALGVMLYEMLSGRSPHPGNPAQVIARLARGDPPTPLAQVCAGIPSDFAALVERAMKHDPRERYPDMRSLAKALDSLSEEALRAGPDQSSGAHARTTGSAEEPLELAATSIDAHAPTASSPSSQGAALPTSDTPAAASVAEQQLGHDFRTLVIVTVLAALAVVGSMLWLVRPPPRGPTALQGELQQAVARCRSSGTAGPIEIRVALGTDGTPTLTLATPNSLSLPDATCVRRELDEMRRALDPTDLDDVPFSVQIDQLDPDGAAPRRGR